MVILTSNSIQFIIYTMNPKFDQSKTQPLQNNQINQYPLSFIVRNASKTFHNLKQIEANSYLRTRNRRNRRKKPQSRAAEQKFQQWIDALETLILEEN